MAGISLTIQTSSGKVSATTVTTLDGNTLIGAGYPVALGDFQLASFGIGSARTYNAAPAGWNKFVDTVVGSTRLGIFWRQVTDLSAQYSFTFASTGPVVSRASWFKNVDMVNPIDTTPVTASSGATTSWTGIPGFTPVTEASWAYWWIVAGTVSTASTKTLTLGANMTPDGSLVVPDTTGAGFIARGAYDPDQVAGVATGTRSATVSSTAAWAAAGFGIRPADVPVAGGPEPGRRLLLAA